MAKAISVRLDDDSERALRVLEASGLTRSEAIRSSLRASAERLHRRRVAAPVNIDDRPWPHRDYQAEQKQDAQSRSYMRRSQRLTVRGLQRLGVFIDLESEQILQIMPEPNPAGEAQVQVELPPGASIPPGATEEDEEAGK